jgi:hypothetical protein
VHLPKRYIIVAIAFVVAGTMMPIRTAWSAPAVRIDELAAPEGKTVALPWPSSHLGVRWGGADAAPIELRWRGAGESVWGGWQPVVESHDLESHGKHGSGLIVATNATAVQLRVPDGVDATELEVVAIDALHGPRHIVVAHDAGSRAAASMTDPKVGPPPIITRAEWGADESLRGKDAPEFAPITKFVVHHTASEEGPDPAATIRAILAYHTKTNGWNDIGYNFLIDSSGRVYEGRWARDYDSGEVHDGEDRDGNGVTGAHAAGNNNPGSVGIALLGDFTGASPSRAAIGALERMLAWKADRHDVDLLGSAEWSNGVGNAVVGHRDVFGTACPGGKLYDWLPTIRTEANHISASARTKNPTLGYWALGSDSAVYSFGDAQYYGGSGQVPTPVVSMAVTPTGNGYWLLSANGRVSPFGDAIGYGSTEGKALNRGVVRLEPTRTGLGYWILAADGGVFSFGDAQFYGSTGSMRLNSPIISMAATTTARGYWLLAGDGGVFTFGDAAFNGSTGSMKLNAPVVSMAPAPSGNGYWLQARDGGIFTFGALRFYGSVPGLRLAGTASTVQIRVTPTGEGYDVLGADGGVFTFGDARFHGAQPGMSGGAPAVDLALKTKLPPAPVPTTTTTLKPTTTTAVVTVPTTTTTL